MLLGCQLARQQERKCVHLPLKPSILIRHVDCARKYTATSDIDLHAEAGQSEEHASAHILQVFSVLFAFGCKCLHDSHASVHPVLGD